MVRAVPIFEKMGFTIPSYNGATKTATISNAAGDASYTFTNDSTKAIKTVNGASSEIELDVPATLYNDTFYVPLRKFCDMCGLSISWENDARSVYVNSAATETSNTAPGTAVTSESAAAAATPAPTEATTAPASGDSAIDFSAYLGTWYGYDPNDINNLTDPNLKHSSDPVQLQTKFVIAKTSATTAGISVEDYNNAYPFDSMTSLTFESADKAYSNQFTFKNDTVKFELDFAANIMKIINVETGADNYLQPVLISQKQY